MAIVIEDGSSVDGANSFATVEEAQEFATSRGITTLNVDADAERSLLLAMDYIETFESSFAGLRTYVGQIVPFPRSNLYVNGELLENDAIPWQIKKVQILAAIEASKGTLLMPTVSGADNARIKREKVGPIETEYENSIPVGYFSSPQIDSLLSALFGAMSGLQIRRG